MLGASTSVTDNAPLVLEPRTPRVVLPLVAIAVASFDAHRRPAGPPRPRRRSPPASTPRGRSCPCCASCRLVLVAGLGSAGLGRARLRPRRRSDRRRRAAAAVLRHARLLPPGVRTGRASRLFRLNPLAVLIDLYRAILLDARPPSRTDRAGALARLQRRCSRSGRPSSVASRPGWPMSSEPPIVRFERVSKTYRLHRRVGHRRCGRCCSRASGPARGTFCGRCATSRSTSPPGSTTALIGGNGAGKSTLLRLAAGSRAPAPGGPRGAAQHRVGARPRRDLRRALTGAENAFTALVVNGLVGAPRRPAALTCTRVRRARGLLR